MNVSILGCGWLGLPLAEKLIEKGFHVKGSTTSRDKFQELRDKNITPYQIQLFEEGIQGDFSSFLIDAEALIIDIPPGLRSNPKSNFVAKIRHLIPYIEISSVNKVLFISSTSVYEDTQAIPTYLDTDPANSTGNTAKQLIETENLLRGNQEFSTTILRFGGLLGAGRHPIKQLSGKTGLKYPKAPVNLIQQQDCMEIILHILEKETWDETFNAAYPEHPTKQEFYTAAAQEKNLSIPEFDDESTSKGKIIASDKLEELLEFKFSHRI